MSIEAAVFAVQRGKKQYGCIGEELSNKLKDGDLLAIQRGNKVKKGSSDQVQDTDLLACTDTDGVTYSVTGAQFKSLFGPEAMPWDGHDGGIFHVISSKYTYFNKEVTMWDSDGTNERKAYNTDRGDDVVIITDPNCNGLLKYDTGGPVFGPLTDTSKVTSMNGMFSMMVNFKGENLSTWDVSNVTDMERMFDDCQDFIGDISGWDTSNVTNMDKMFADTEKFNHDLTNWNVDKVTDYWAFNRSSVLEDKNCPKWVN